MNRIFFTSRKTSLVFGYFAIIAIALICNIYINNFISDIFNVTEAVRNAICLYPPFALWRGLQYLADEVAYGGPGFSLSTLSTDVVNIAEVYYWLIGEWFVIMALVTFLKYLSNSHFIVVVFGTCDS